MATIRYTFETHDTHIFCCLPEPNPFGFQLTFPLPLPSTARVRSPANAWAICVPSPGFRPSITPSNGIDYSPIDDEENRHNWKFVHVRVTPRVYQTWIYLGREKFLAGTCLYLLDSPRYGEFCNDDVHHFLGSIGDEDYMQRVNGLAPNYNEGDLKVLFLNSTQRGHFLYARVHGVVQKFIFNRRRYRFELLREQPDDDDTPMNFDVFRGSDDVLMKYYNMTIYRNKEGFLEKRVNGRKMKPSPIFLQRVKVQYGEEIQLPEDVQDEEESDSEDSEEEEEEEEETGDQTVYFTEDVPKVEHEEEVMAEEADYFRWNQVVTDSSSDDDENEFIVVD